MRTLFGVGQGERGASALRSAAVAVLWAAAVPDASMANTPSEQAVRDVGVRKTDYGMVVQPSVRMSYAGAPWDYEVRVALPPSYSSSTKRYPVLWVMDGSMNFEMAVQTVRMPEALPETIVVAVGTPPDADREMLRRRTYDFTSTGLGMCTLDGPGADEYNRKCAATPENEMTTGGAAAFLKFLTTDVRARIESQYRSSGDNTLFGYSGGGRFCLYSVLTRPDAFNSYICGSPGRLTERSALFNLERHYAQNHRDLKAKLFISVGEAEIVQGDHIPAAGLVSRAIRMAELLHVRAYPSLQLIVRVLPNEVHGPRGQQGSLFHGLRALWSENVTQSD